MPIILITIDDKDSTGKNNEIIVSHGVDMKTGKAVILPNDTPASLGAIYSKEYCEWIIPDKTQSVTQNIKSKLENTVEETKPADPLDIKKSSSFNSFFKDFQ